MRTIVLAYSGGLDTTVMVPWLKEKYKAQVITVTVNVGQQENMKDIEEKAKTVGATRHYCIEAQDTFVKDYVFPALKANALYEGKYPLSSALSRPLIATKTVEVAKKEKAWAIAHGSTGKGNDQLRFEITMKALAPNVKVLAPLRDWKLSRDVELNYAKKHGIPISDKRKKYSIDQNLWGRAIECGPLEDPAVEPPEDAFEWTVAPEKTPAKPEYATIDFEKGIPIGLNGRKLDGVKLINKLNEIGSRHGVGRIDHLEDRVVGIKTRELYECPAACILIEAHSDLEKLTLTRHELTVKHQLEQQWIWLAYSGLWVDPLREDIEAFIDKSQEKVTGWARVKLCRGSISPVGRSSPNALYDRTLASYGVRTTFDQSLGAGFTELWGLASVVGNWSKLRRKQKVNENL